MTSLAVVIPAWNSADFLDPCLQSLSGQVPASDTIVVDNGSRDELRAVVERHGVRVLAFDRNLGFAAAVNAGVSLAGTDLVLVLNADTTVDGGAVELLAARLDGDSGLGGVQPRILQANTDPPRVYSSGQVMRRDGRAYERGAGELDGPPFRTPEEVFGVCGAAALLRTELFGGLGGFEESFFAFHEDVELNARARLAGWRFAYEPGAVVRHHGNAVWMREASAPLAFNTRLVARNRLATDVKVLPLRCLPRVCVAEVGAIIRSVRRGTLRAALAGRAAALARLPALLAERRRLRRGGDVALLEEWLA